MSFIPATLLLIHASLVVYGATAAVTCPTLPPDDAAIRLSLTAATYNGSKTQSLAFNSTKWGPTLRLDLGKLYQIDVTNADIDGGTSVHWHGQHMANASWADGAAGLTQGTIPPGATFSYRFTAGPEGTHWYHSHTGAQFGDGLRGALIVSSPADPSTQLYDEDQHLLLLADVFNQTPVAAQLAAAQRGSAAMAACGGLDLSDAPWYAAEVNGEAFATTGKPAVLTVQAGRRYRIRTIGGMSSWALAVAVQGHNMTLIAMDGQPVRPQPVAALVLQSGERADFVLAADQPVGNYFVNVTTLNGHNSPAILHYEGALDPATDPAVAATAYSAELGCLIGSPPGWEQTVAMRAGPGVPPPPQESDRKLTVFLSFGGATAAPASITQSTAQPGNPYGFAPFAPPPTAAAAPISSAAPAPKNGGPSSCPSGSGQYCWSLNWNVFAMPASLPIYTANTAAADSAAAAATAANSSSPNNSGGSEPGSYSINLRQGEVVDLTLINKGSMTHPMHLHGSSFWVLALGHGAILGPNNTLNTTAAALNLVNPPLRDTVPVPPALMMQPAAGGGGTGSTQSMPGMDGSGSMQSMPGMGSSSGSMDSGSMPGMSGGSMASRTMPAMGDSSMSGSGGTSGMQDMPEMGGSSSSGTMGGSSSGTVDGSSMPDMPGMSTGTDGSSSSMQNMPGMDGTSGSMSSGSMSSGSMSMAQMTASPEAQGYAVVRFVADNPGVWAFHCHIDLHSESGMMLYFVVQPPLDTANSSSNGSNGSSSGSDGSSGISSSSGSNGSGSGRGWYAPEGLECGGSGSMR